MSLAALGLPPTATVAQVKARWRVLAARCHPDRGGEAAAFASLNAAYRAALAAAEQPLPCPACGGTGLRAVGAGWSQVKLPCLTCHGARTIPRAP